MGVIINEFEAIAEAPASEPTAPDTEPRERKEQAPDPMALAGTLVQLAEQAVRVWAH